MLPTIKDVCVLNEGALDIRISDGIERIDEDTLDLSAGEKFLKHSYLTKGMKELVNEGFKRLSGSSGGRPVFRLKQAMGGGKTHLIKTMAFLARHPSLRNEYFPEAASRFVFDSAKVAFFNGREQPNDFFWGRIADQLGHKGIFQEGAHSPGEEHWHSLFDRLSGPALILLDEMPTYFGYYRTQVLGDGTVADVAGRAFANMLSAAIGRKDICILVSDLEASHADGTQIIDRALENARKELSRVEVNITPVDLSGDETYAILKKRLFSKLPSETEVNHIAESFGKAIEQAQKSKTIDNQKTPEQITLEVAQTYPFHPQMKHLFALFKENKEFQQTRGLMELASRLLRSVWDRKSNDVLLIGPQHFDLSIDDVREKVISISRLDDAIAKDIFSDDGGAHAQTIDANNGNDAATQVANLVLISSLSTAVNPIKGLTTSEVLECLATPNADLSFFQSAIESLTTSSWYLHRSAEGRIYFDKLENLTKMLTGLAEKAPEPKVHELVANRLRISFEPKTKRAYQKVLALPRIDEIQADVQSGRVLAIITPDSKLPPEEILKLFDVMPRKNNLLVLSGEKSFEVGKLYEAARQVYAAEQAAAAGKVKRGDPQWEEFEDLKGKYELHFNGVIKSLFDRLLVPRQRPGSEPKLEAMPLEQVGSTTDGEAQIEATLTRDPIKLYLDWTDPAKFSGIRTRIERLFGNQDEVAWNDIKDKIQSDCSMYFLVPGDLDKIKSRAVNEVLWEDLQNGWISKKPKPKTSGVLVTPTGQMNDGGETTLSISVINANPETTHIHYCEDGEVSEESPKLDDPSRLVTKALSVAFLAIDISGRTEKGKPFIWKNDLKVQFDVSPIKGTNRKVKINVLPKASLIKYTLDGSEPRNGETYKEPFQIDEKSAMLLVFAEDSGLEKKQQFQIPSGAEGSSETTRSEPPLSKPVVYPASKMQQLNTREAVYLCMNKAIERDVEFEEFRVVTQQGQESAQFGINGQLIKAAKVNQIMESFFENFSPEATLLFQFKSAHFKSGQDLVDLANSVGLNYSNGDWKEI
jgi:hypothetical protein